VELNGRFVEGVEYLRNKDFKSAQCDSPARCTKIAEILDACEVRDVMALRSLAVSKGGLISDDLRRRAC
jgi:TBC1 domain family member 20